MKLPKLFPFFQSLMLGLGILNFIFLMDAIFKISDGQRNTPLNSVVAFALFSGLCFVALAISFLRKDQD